MTPRAQHTASIMAKLGLAHGDADINRRVKAFLRG
ncbi:hypothetical protein HNR07_003882 [Nocardiopsis metallicus]|uniref:Uncharacterized protein n=1 Tax=Nocardiopsis metallicus TaxID=179819 RepID=A0A840WLP9_9ACTN|nr:hypothetical protein [Nocardiopsis metallicus]